MPTFWISWKSTAGCLQSGCGVRMPCTSRCHGYDLPPDLGLAADAAAAPAGGGCEAASMNPYIIIGARLLARELEDRAYADPVAVPQCLSVDRVRRLNLR